MSEVGAEAPEVQEAPPSSRWAVFEDHAVQWFSSEVAAVEHAAMLVSYRPVGASAPVVAEVKHGDG